MATNSNILALRIHVQRSLVGYNLWGQKESDMTKHICRTAEQEFNY